MILGWSISTGNFVTSYYRVLVPFDFGVVYIDSRDDDGNNLVLVPFDFGVVYIYAVIRQVAGIVLVPFDFGVVYIKN